MDNVFMNNVYRSLTADGRRAMYDHITRSLREYLVPMDVFIKQVSKIEDIEAGDLTVSKPSTDILDPYIIPYPHSISSFERAVANKVLSGEYSADSDTFEISREAWKDSKDILKDRLDRLMEKVIPGETVSQIDADSDMGVFLSTVNGSIFPFRYSCIKCYDVISFDFSTAIQRELRAVAVAKGLHIPAARTNIAVRCRIKSNNMKLMPNKMIECSENANSKIEPEELATYITQALAMHMKCVLL